MPFTAPLNMSIGELNGVTEMLKRKIFLSYSSRNKRRAMRLASMLRANGVDVWFDAWDILIGQNIYDEVYEGILNSEFLAIILTGASLKSRWVSEELSIARQRELTTSGVVILPLLFEKIEIPLHLQQKHYADFRKFNKGFTQLMRLLNSRQGCIVSDTHTLQRVTEAVRTEAAVKMQLSIREVCSFAEAGLAAAHIRQVIPPDFQKHAGADNTQFKLTIKFQSLQETITMLVSADTTVDLFLVSVMNALDLPNHIDGHRVAYFLLHEGMPLDAKVSIRQAGLYHGAILNIGCYQYLIE